MKMCRWCVTWLDDWVKTLDGYGSASESKSGLGLRDERGNRTDLCEALHREVVLGQSVSLLVNEASSQSPNSWRSQELILFCTLRKPLDDQPDGPDRSCMIETLSIQMSSHLHPATLLINLKFDMGIVVNQEAITVVVAPRRVY
jgi:hypothetical protein